MKFEFEQVAKHFRQNVAPLSAGQIIIVTNDGDFSGRGRISAVDGKLELAVILDGERELPRIRGKHHARSMKCPLRSSEGP